MHLSQNKYRVISPNRNIYISFPVEIDPLGEPALGDTDVTTGKKKTTTDELHLYRSSLPSWEDDGVKIHC